MTSPILVVPSKRLLANWTERVVPPPAVLMCWGPSGEMELSQKEVAHSLENRRG